MVLLLNADSALYTIFWLSLGILFYTYIGYGLIIFLLTRFKATQKKDHTISSGSLPQVTILIAAYNEEEVLNDKIRNTLELDYPADLLEIMVITDGSTDNSAALLREFPRIRHLHQPERRGKTAAINRAMPYINSPVIIFSDANTLLNTTAIQHLVLPYNNPETGAVAGEKKIRHRQLDGAATAGEGLYWKYESLLKKLDSDFYTTVGAAGELFSIKRELFEPLPEDSIIEDFILSLKVCGKGYVVKYAPEAVATETGSAGLNEEYKRKTRIAAGAFQAISRLYPLFNPFRNLRLSFQLVSHRILRWTLCPPALFLLLPLNLLIVWASSAYTIYSLLLWLQIAFYICALVGWIYAGKEIKYRLFYIPFYFLFMNYCIVAGFFRYLRGGQSVLWEKAARSTQKYTG